MDNKKQCACIIGYACINETLASIKPASKAIMVNRSMIKKTFLEKGTKYAGELALKNLYDLEKVVRWNHEHDIRLYRMSSDMFPWCSEYLLEELPQADVIIVQLQKIGQIAREFKQRLTFHPGQFNVLVSPHEKVVKNTINDLEFHAKVMDYMNLPRSVYAKINIHLGGAYGDKEASMERFCKNFNCLSEAVQSRLTVENDDKTAMYTVKDLYSGVFKKIGIPIVFDNLHYRCNPGVSSEEDSFFLAYETWPKDVEPMIHLSESRQLYDSSSPLRAHADYVEECFDTRGKKVSIMLEAKAKELAVQKYNQICC